MTKINQIEQAIVALSPGAYQKLMDEYLIKKYHFDNISPYGSHTGTDKTTQGTPDSYVRCEDGSFIFIAHGSVGKSFQKVKQDILDCLKPEKTDTPVDKIKQIICCHTSTNFSAGQTAELYSLFDNIIIVGLGDVSYDLLNKYQSLALDHLGIALDTHQFFDLEGFINEYKNNAYTTSLNMPLVCREEELAHLVDAITNESVILLFGESGVGKTRLAIEAAKQYATSGNINLLVLKSNGEAIYNDCASYIDDSKENLVIVDDANELPQIKYLLSLAEDKTRAFPLKLLLTVRDYEKQSLLCAISDMCKPFAIELQRLSDDSISKLLTEVFQIKNQIVIEQILLIAKGNARLAVMAANCVKNQMSDSIRNAVDLFDTYYTPIVSQFNQQELLVASLIAFFDAVPLSESALPIVIANNKGISVPQFIDHCKALYKKEVIKLLDNRAARFDNQNLRDYLLNYCILQEKTLIPSEIIDIAFPKYRRHIVFALNTLFQLFNTPQNTEYLEQQIKTAWDFIRRRDNEAVRCFAESFSSIIPDETLVYLKKEINLLPPKHAVCSVRDFKSSNSSNFHSPLFKILCNFKDYDCFEDAIELGIYYLEHTTENAADCYKLFGEAWGFEYKSSRNGFSQEALLVEKLLDYYHTLPSDRSALCLYSFIKNNMQYSFSCTEETHDLAVRFITFHIPPCEKVFFIRKKCLEGLFRLYTSNDHQEWAVEILANLFHTASADDILVLQNDVKVFAELFASILNSADIYHCLFLQRLQMACETNGLPYPESLPRCTENKIYAAYAILKENCIRKYYKHEDFEALRTRDIEELCDKTSSSEFAELWKALSKPPLNSQKHGWEIGTGINLVFSYLQNDQSKFMECVNSYLSNNAPFGSYCAGLINGLIGILGYANSEDYLSSFNFDYKNYWISQIHNLIPTTQMDIAVCERILAISSQPGDSIYPILFETAKRANQVYPGFMVKYLSILTKKAIKRPELISNFLRPLTHDAQKEIDELLQLFSGSLETIQTAYILAMQGEPYFDYHGDLFLALIKRSQGFLSLVVAEILLERHNVSDTSLLNSIWRAENYMELVSSVLDSLRLSSKYSFYASKVCEQLISTTQENGKYQAKIQIWITQYISIYSTDIARMKFLFSILCNCSKDVLAQALVTFCHHNKSFENFKSLQLTETMYSWSGSEIPVIDSRLDYLENLRTQLRGIDYAEHRVWLSELIQANRVHKSHVEAEEFMSRT